MQVHIFRSLSGSYGFTPYADGSNLPSLVGPWVHSKSVQMEESDPPRIAFSTIEALSLIARDGFYLLNTDADLSDL